MMRSAELLLRAMINAAKADGQIDGTEMNNILNKLDEAGASQETKDFVLAEMRRPLDLDVLVADVTLRGWRPLSTRPRPWRSRSTPLPNRTTCPSWPAGLASRRGCVPAWMPASELAAASEEMTPVSVSAEYRRGSRSSMRLSISRSGTESLGRDRSPLNISS